jgi:hypothetical protein
MRSAARGGFVADSDESDESQPKDIETVRQEAAAKFKSTLSWGESCCVVLDNLPIVTDTAKIPKFIAVLSKIFAECGKTAGGKIAHVDVPTHAETGATFGFAFIEFTHIECVKDAVKYGDGYKMGKSIYIKVSEFTIIDSSDSDEASLALDEESQTLPPTNASQAADDVEGLVRLLFDGLKDLVSKHQYNAGTTKPVRPVRTYSREKKKSGQTGEHTCGSGTGGGAVVLVPNTISSQELEDVILSIKQDHGDWSCFHQKFWESGVPKLMQAIFLRLKDFEVTATSENQVKKILKKLRLPVPARVSVSVAVPSIDDAISFGDATIIGKRPPAMNSATSIAQDDTSMPKQAQDAERSDSKQVRVTCLCICVRFSLMKFCCNIFCSASEQKPAKKAKKNVRRKKWGKMELTRPSAKLLQQLMPQP